MALASALLKHLAISKLAPVPWKTSTITRDAHKKPIYVCPTTATQPVSFNITHQASLVALVAVAHYQSPDSVVETGIDLVCTSERRDRDHRLLQSGGWPSFVNTYAEVFSVKEATYLKYEVPWSIPGLVKPYASQEQIDDGKLRTFYALWALREAYVKLTGEALVAGWLKELEFVRFRPPVAGLGAEGGSLRGGECGESEVEEEEKAGRVIRQMEIYFRGKRVDDVNICLRSIGPDYMICTAVRTPGRKEDGLGWTLGGFEVLELEEVLGFAETH